MRLLIVDDHTLFRDGMRLLLDTFDEDIEFCEAGSCEAAVELVGRSPADLILLDMKLPGVSGLDALLALREVAGEAAIVVLSGEDSPQLVRDTIDAGAVGFIPKSSSRTVLLNALRLVLAGGIYLPRIALDGIDNAGQHVQARPKQPIDGLSDRQMQVLRAVIRGRPNKAIARDLGISEHTVKSHLASVFRALGVGNRTEAVFAAAKLGIRLA